MYIYNTVFLLYKHENSDFIMSIILYYYLFIVLILIVGLLIDNVCNFMEFCISFEKRRRYKLFSVACLLLISRLNCFNTNIMPSAERIIGFSLNLHPDPVHLQSGKITAVPSVWTRHVQTPPLWRALQSTVHQNHQTREQLLPPPGHPSDEGLISHTAHPLALSTYFTAVIEVLSALIGRNTQR